MSSVVDLTPVEVASGVICGMAERWPRLEPAVGTTSEAIEAVFARALQAGPTYLTFSGGRDSSVLLALGTRVARRLGLPPPVPLTYRFPGHADTEESEFQEVVIEHLGTPEWQILTPAEGELDLVGPIAEATAGRIGVRWPFNIFFLVPMMEAARGGTLITAVGGDEITSPGAHADLAGVFVGRRRPRRGDLRWLAAVHAPRALRAQRIRRAVPHTSWLTPHGADLFVRAFADEEARVPLRTDRQLVRHTWRSRYFGVLVSTLDALADAQGVPLVSPFLDAGVVAAAAAESGVAGIGSRTDFVNRLVGDLLPESIRARPSKASFDSVFWGARTQRWVSNQHAEELPVDRDLVDPHALLAHWRTPVPEARSFLLAQACAFASDGTLR